VTSLQGRGLGAAIDRPPPKKKEKDIAFSQNFLLVRKFSSQTRKIWGRKAPTLGNLGAKLNFEHPYLFLSEICSCLPENCHFLPSLS